MPATISDIFPQQVDRLREPHFLVLFWIAQAESKETHYNLTNAFDDLKAHDITRTKQTAMACVESLVMLCFVLLREERNRKNLYITSHGARALERLVADQRFQLRRSFFLEGTI